MKTQRSYVIDPTYKGNLARFINHSCDPNCETQKWNVLGKVCVGIFAIKDIKENEELSFDYHFDCYSTPFSKCYCGAENCRGYLGVAPTAGNPQGKSEDEHANSENKTSQKEKREIKYKLEDLLKYAEEIEEELQKATEEKEKIQEQTKNDPEEMEEALKEINRKYKGNCMNFNFFYLFQKRVLSSHTKKREKKVETAKKPKTRKTRPKKNSDVLVPLIECVATENEEAKNQPPEPMVITETEEKNDIQTAKPKKYCHKESEKPTPVKNVDTRSELQRELDTEVKSLVKSRKTTNDSDRKLRKSVLITPKDLHLIRLCLGVLLPFNDIKQSITEIGARLFWETAAAETVNMNIIGTNNQIELVLQAIQAIQEKYKAYIDTHKVSLFVPKIFLKKVLVAQSAYKLHYDVELSISESDLSSEIYPIHDTTKVTFTGESENTDKVKTLIEDYVESLLVTTLQLSLSEANMIKESFHSINLLAEPAEIRLSNSTSHNDMKELNHPLYFIPNYSRDLAIIGTESEVRIGEKVIAGFLKERRGVVLYSLSMLLPASEVEKAKRQREEMMKRCGVQIFIYEPINLRKYATVLFIGAWDSIKHAKETFEKALNVTSLPSSALLQQAQFCYSSLKTMLLRNNAALMPHWDLLSDSILDTAKLGTKALYSKMEPETIVHILLATDKAEYEKVMEVMGVTKKDLLHILKKVLENVADEYAKKQREKDDKDERKKKKKHKKKHKKHKKKHYKKHRSHSRRSSSISNESRSKERGRSRSREKSRTKSRERPRYNSSSRDKAVHKYKERYYQYQYWSMNEVIKKI
eukprot:TRINITY_DN6132_c0_g1_i1.p1 TRINITY_DN6132_c0_g1~~TRINITY_DN6132_c0_g1_i1.p1  ORF type:complete len:811 (-),score=115.33 TRINITY_DN6132_c0_g1_i1:38-2470(-)